MSGRDKRDAYIFPYTRVCKRCKKYYNTPYTESTIFPKCKLPGATRWANDLTNYEKTRTYPRTRKVKNKHSNGYRGFRGSW